jgi:hypothetical protein
VAGLGCGDVVHSVLSGVRLVVVGLLPSCVGVDHRSWVFSLSAVVLQFAVLIVTGWAPNYLLS